jgi:DNA invertase Pin-like site-specific DNA recombinase
VEFCKRNYLQPVEFIEEQVSGKTAIAERKLGKELIPSLKAGDALVAGEISLLGCTRRDVLTCSTCWPRRRSRCGSLRVT